MFNLEIIAKYNNKSEAYTLKGDGLDSERIMEILDCPMENMRDIAITFTNISFFFEPSSDVTDLDAVQKMIHDKGIDKDIIETVFDCEWSLDEDDFSFLSEGSFIVEADSIEGVHKELGIKRFGSYVTDVPKELYKFIDFEGIGKDWAEDLHIFKSSLGPRSWFVIQQYTW